jgi:hypothetical protein
MTAQTLGAGAKPPVAIGRFLATSEDYQGGLHDLTSFIKKPALQMFLPSLPAARVRIEYAICSAS